MVANMERGPGATGVERLYLYVRDDDGHRVEVYTSDYFTGDPGPRAAALGRAGRAAA